MADNSALSDEDIQSLQDYAARMQAMGGDTRAPAIVDNDAAQMTNGPIAASAAEAIPTEQTFTEKKGGDKGGHQKPTLAFSLPQSVVEGATVVPQAITTAAQDLNPFRQYQALQHAYADPGSVSKSATRLKDVAIDEAHRASSGTVGPPGLVGLGLSAVGNMDTSDVARRRADAAKAKSDETAAAQSGALSPQDQAVASGQAMPSSATVLPERWARVNSPESRALEEQVYGQGRERELQDDEINARLANQKMIEAAAEKEGQDRAELERARLERQRAQSVMTKSQNDLDAANKAYQAASIDPNRFYKNRSSAENVMSAIGVALGAFGASMTHSPNFALDIINKAVDNDIEAQKAEIAKKGQGANNMLAKLKEATGSYDSAENMFKVAALQHAKAQADQLNAQGQDSKLQAQLGDAIEKLKTSHLGYVDTHTAHIPAQLVGGGGGLSTKDMDMVFRGSDGNMYKAPNQKAYDELAKANDAHAATQQGLTNYENALKGVSDWDRAQAKIGIITPAMRQAQRARVAALVPIRQAGDEGVYKKSEEALMEQQLPEPESFFGQPKAAIGESRRAADTILNSKMKVYAPENVSHGYGRNAQGNITPRAAYTGHQAKPLVATPDAFKKE